MVVSVADIKEMLPSYQGLKDEQIQKAIDLAKSYLNGLNPDWENYPEKDTIHEMASLSMTLKLHFPQNVNAYTQLDTNVMEMVNSLWSSANMVRKRTGFFRQVQDD